MSNWTPSEDMAETSDSYPGPLRVVVDHMERNGLVHKVETDRHAVTFNIRGRSGGNFRCVGFLSDAMDLFQFLVIYPDQVPANRRKAMARAIAMANFGMKLGFFELDLDDGELRVHTASAFEKDNLPESVVEWCVSSALAIADRYYPALQSVSWGDSDPTDAIFRAEHPEASILMSSDDDDSDDSEDEPTDPGPDARNRDDPESDSGTKDRG